jgi:L-arabinokinase
MPTTIAYYVSGHGFGHARRTVPLLRALAAARPDLRIVVRTQTPAFIFQGLPNVTVSDPRDAFDPGVVERDPLCIDPGASVHRLTDVLSRRDQIVAEEAAFLHDARAQLVVADIPFLAADAAESAGVPSVAVGNFTWDWIFEPFVSRDQAPLIEQIRDSYRKMLGLLRLPFGHDMCCFRTVTDVPMLANRPPRDRTETRARLKVDEADTRPRVLVAMRGGTDADALHRVAAESPEILFFVNQPVDGAPPNLRAVDPAGGIDFTDLLTACDVAVSKLGFGIVSDCVATDVALLYPPRVGFREDGITRAQCPRYVRMRELPAADFQAGRWREPLLALLRQSPPPERMPIDGDEVIARTLLEHLPHP